MLNNIPAPKFGFSDHLFQELAFCSVLASLCTILPFKMKSKTNTSEKKIKLIVWIRKKMT